MSALLITQCLQNDFCQLLDPYDPLPNRLHIGHAEALRLLGERTEEGPVGVVMDWAYQQPPERLGLIHIRDWHDPADPAQAEHLRRFSPHCLAGSPGAEFVFRTAVREGRPAAVVDSLGLNDFTGTPLAGLLNEAADLAAESASGGGVGAPGPRLRVGVMGVWTEAKVSFLTYELVTRWPSFEVGLCSALCAGSSRSAHLLALEQLADILGVRIFHSVAEFTDWLAGSHPDPGARPGRRLDPSRLAVRGTPLLPEDEPLALYLYRDCQSVEAKGLDGGFSGNRVFKVSSRDRFGHAQVPTVLKTGPRALIAQERLGFERIQEVLGNNAPSIVDFAEMGERGALKYRYAAMLDGAVRTFQDLYLSGAPEEELFAVLDRVFAHQLGRLYEAASLEKMNLLEEYGFAPRWAESVEAKVQAVLAATPERPWAGAGSEPSGASDPTGASDPAGARDLTGAGGGIGPVGASVPGQGGIGPAGAHGAGLKPGAGQVTPGGAGPGSLAADFAAFYRDEVPRLQAQAGRLHYRSFIHGDLNGRNVLVDAQGNVWLIDFFHTRRGPVLQDLIKFENDLLYIWTPVAGPDEFDAARALSARLAAHSDLAEAPDPDEAGLWQTVPALARAWRSLCRLRRLAAPLVRHDRSPYQWQVGALRYAVHTLSFDESSLWQRRWALESAHLYKEGIRALYAGGRRLRLDWVPEVQPGRLALTILPGRRDRDRDLESDLNDLVKAGVTAVACLLTPDEFGRYGVPNLRQAYADRGLAAYYAPIPDQGVPTRDQLEGLLEFFDAHLERNEAVVVHCVGGLGRSGLAAAAWLILRQGYSYPDALRAVRAARSPRAVETKVQERFLAGLTGEGEPAPGAAQGG